MSKKSQRQKLAKHKYADKPARIKVNGERVVLGGAEEMLCHIKWSFHRHLEMVINDPHLPNPWEQTQDPELRKLLKAEGIIGITQQEMVKKAEEYMDRIANGEEPYSDKLHDQSPEWSPSTVNGPVSVLIDRKTGNWQQLPTALGLSVTST